MCACMCVCLYVCTKKQSIRSVFPRLTHANITAWSDCQLSNRLYLFYNISQPLSFCLSSLLRYVTWTLIVAADKILNYMTGAISLKHMPNTDLRLDPLTQRREATKFTTVRSSAHAFIFFSLLPLMRLISWNITLGIAQKGPMTPITLHVCFSTWVEELVTSRRKKILMTSSTRRPTAWLISSILKKKKSCVPIVTYCRFVCTCYVWYT